MSALDRLLHPRRADFVLWPPRRRPVPFDADLPYRLYAAGTSWVRCTGCPQPNHSDGGFAWRDEEPDRNGGTAHAGRGWIRQHGKATR